MAVISEKLELSWAGKDHTINIDFKLINAIEQDVNLQKFSEAVSIGDIRYSDVCVIFCHMFNSVGVQVVPDDMWHAMFRDQAFDASDTAELLKVLDKIMKLLFVGSSKKN